MVVINSFVISKERREGWEGAGVQPLFLLANRRILFYFILFYKIMGKNPFNV